MPYTHLSPNFDAERLEHPSKSETSATTQRVDAMSDATAQHWHGLVADTVGREWPLPRCVAKSDKANRADQGNKTPANEYMDEPAVLEAKVDIFADLLRRSRSTCAYTGAGLSKASGIPDYASKAEKSVVAGPKIRSSLDALPTYAHQCLVLLHQNNLMHSWVQQNHDGLPQKAGFPQEHVNEIHGAWFDPSNPVVQFDGSLRHDLFQWMLEQEKATDLCLCLGTSLSGMNADRMVETPARRAAKSPPGALGSVIINLQKTRLDAKSTVRIWGKLDDVFQLLLRKLSIAMPHGGLAAKPLPPGDIFVVPYNAAGEPDSRVEMRLNLSLGTAITVPNSHAVNFQQIGRVAGKSSDGNYIVDIDGVRRALGTWMIDAAIRGALPQLPIMNPKPSVRTKDDVRPPPPPQPQMTEDDMTRKLQEMEITKDAGAARSALRLSQGDLGKAAGLLLEKPDDGEDVEMSDAESEDAEVQGADAQGASPLPEFIEVIQGHKRVASNDEDGNQHEWSLRLREGAQQIVQEVLWRLHPTFRKPDVKVKGPTFQIDRIGWGVFEVGIMVKLQPHILGGKVLEGSHMLTFEREGDRAAVTRIRL